MDCAMRYFSLPWCFWSKIFAEVDDLIDPKQTVVIVLGVMSNSKHTNLTITTHRGPVKNHNHAIKSISEHIKILRNNYQQLS